MNSTPGVEEKYARPGGVPEYIGEGKARDWWIPVSEEVWNTAAGN
jgi:hypothetical protein